MFPLALPSMPGYGPSAANAYTTTQSTPYSVQTDIGALARQQLPIAVVSTAAPAAYSPDTQQSRQAQQEKRTQSNVSDNAPVIEDGAANDDVAALRAAALADTPEIRFFNLQPSRLGQAFSTQFAAQYLAQETRGEGSREIRFTVTPNRSGLPKARGAEAYTIAVTRNSAQPPVEQVAL